MIQRCLIREISARDEFSVVSLQFLNKHIKSNCNAKSQCCKTFFVKVPALVFTFSVIDFLMFITLPMEDNPYSFSHITVMGFTRKHSQIVFLFPWPFKYFYFSEERGVDNAFAEKMADWCTAHEQSLYIKLLQERNKFIFQISI